MCVIGAVIWPESPFDGTKSTSSSVKVLVPKMFPSGTQTVRFRVQRVNTDGYPVGDAMDIPAQPGSGEMSVDGLMAGSRFELEAITSNGSYSTPVSAPLTIVTAPDGKSQAVLFYVCENYCLITLKSMKAESYGCLKFIIILHFVPTRSAMMMCVCVFMCVCVCVRVRACVRVHLFVLICVVFVL